MPEQVHFALASNSRERKRCVLALKTRLVFSIDTMFFSPNYRNCLTSRIFQQVAGIINPKDLKATQITPFDLIQVEMKERSLPFTGARNYEFTLSTILERC